MREIEACFIVMLSELFAVMRKYNYVCDWEFFAVFLRMEGNKIVNEIE